MSHLDCVVSETTDNLLIIILQAVDPFAVLTATLDSGQSVPATPPVCFHVLRKKTIGASKVITIPTNMNNSSIHYNCGQIGILL